MHVNFSLQNFRCFASPGAVHIAPITLLVGENSTGKSSFLAALRQVLEVFQVIGGSSFNREPYYLGSFEQIAHYRGGRSGRAKTFCLSIEIGADDGQEELIVPSRRSIRNTTHQVTFAKGTTQPELVRYSVTARSVSAEFDFSSSKPKITFGRTGEAAVQVDPDRAPPSALMRRDVSYLAYYLQDVLLNSRSDSVRSDDRQGETVKTLVNTVRSASRYLQKRVFASAPVRIQPRRVYTPSELTSLNAGEQVPLEMANQKLTSPEKWQLTKSRLVEFGSKAGLFEDVDIKRFGKTDSDPFQLQIKNQGPAANIVDVGYGVSQALPLLYPLQSDSGYDVFLLQQPEVHLHPRAQAEFGSLLTSLSRDHRDCTYVVETHSDFIVDRVRADVRAGIVSPKDVSILLFRREGLDVAILPMGLDEKGEISGYPDDYREFFLREQARILGI